MEAPTRMTAILGNRLRRFVLTVSIVACGLALTVGPAEAANFTWSGAAAKGEAQWSNGANWDSGTAPNVSVGTLTFPALTSPACTAQPPHRHVLHE